MHTITTKNVLIAFGFIAIAIVSKLATMAYPNVETFSAISILAGVLLGPYLGMLVAIAAVVGKDMAIGNTSILIYTWSAWAIIGASSAWLSRYRAKNTIIEQALQLTGWSIITTLFFYVWTNFGVWHIGGLYPHTWQGLIDCYIAGIPFMRNQFAGNLMIVPVFTLMTLSLWQYAPVLKPVVWKSLKTH